MCTLLHRPQILFLDEPTNGVDPVSRREFWTILYQLIEDGVTVFVTTAYLDEAERCNRVGLLHKGRLLRCESPEAMRYGAEETCYEVMADNLRGFRNHLASRPGVVSAEPFGTTLHVFLEKSVDPTVLERAEFGSRYRSITPSLEDIFIATVRKDEREKAQVN